MRDDSDPPVPARGDVGLDAVSTRGGIEFVRIERVAQALGTDTTGVRTLIQAGELVGYELVDLTSLAALQRRLAEQPEPAGAAA